MIEHIRHLAQMAAEHELVARLLSAGGAATILSIVLAWFMFKNERNFDRIGLALERLSHKFHGMTKAMLIDTMSRESTGPTARRLAQEMINDIEATERANDKSRRADRDD